MDIRSGDFYQKIVRAYLYVPQESQFCSSEDAAGVVYGLVTPKFISPKYIQADCMKQ